MDENASAFAAQTLSYYQHNNRAAAISWAHSFLALNAYNPDENTVDDLIATARKIEAYLDGGSAG